MRRILALALLVTCWTSAWAHQDVYFERLPNGEIPGFPAEYGPASLIIPEGDDSYDGAVVLRLGKNVVAFPGCLSILFLKAERPHIEISASWYHDPDLLPYYLEIHLPTKKPREGAIGYDGWSVLLNLETGEVLSVEARFISNGGHSARGQEIDLNTFCTDEEVASLAPKKTSGELEE